MGWSVFDGTPADSHEDLFRFARLQTPNGKAVLAGLEWADDPDWYVAHALDNGFKPSAADVISILGDWGYSDQKGLLYRCLGPFTQAQVLTIAELVDEGLVADFVTKSRSFGAEFDDAGIAKLGELTGDPGLVDSLVSARIVERGPYKPWELNTPAGTPSPVEFCSHSMFEGAVAGMDGRFTYGQAMDLVNNHICEDYTDDTLEAILSVTDCTADEADMLLFGNGYSRRPDPLLAPTQASRPARKAGLFEAIGAAFIGKAAWDALHGGSGAASSGEPAFQDYNHAWGSNNDHNWEADGDMRWDDYSGM